MFQTTEESKILIYEKIDAVPVTTNEENHTSYRIAQSSGISSLTDLGRPEKLRYVVRLYG